MRIVGGDWRGRKLADVGDGDAEAHLRPSSDRFRETVFNILRGEKYGSAPNGMRVLDLFAGTGALSFEALSRGASFATLVDQGVKARALIRENTQSFKCIQRAQLLRRDATDLGECKDEPFDLVFMDPPYSQGLGEKAINSAISGGWLHQNAVIIWEDELAPALPPSLEKQDERQIGRAILTIARYKGAS